MQLALKGSKKPMQEQRTAYVLMAHEGPCVFTSVYCTRAAAQKQRWILHGSLSLEGEKGWE